MTAFIESRQQRICIRGGRVIDPENTDESTLALRVFNDRVAADTRFASVMLAVADGLTLLCKK